MKSHLDRLKEMKIDFPTDDSIFICYVLICIQINVCILIEIQIEVIFFPGDRLLFA